MTTITCIQKMLTLPSDILASLSEYNPSLSRVSREMGGSLRSTQLVKIVTQQISTREIFNFLDDSEERKSLVVISNYVDEYSSGSCFLHFTIDHHERELSGIITNDGKVSPIPEADLMKLSRMRNLETMFVNAPDHVSEIALGEEHRRFGISRESVFFLDLQSVRTILGRRVTGTNLSDVEKSYVSRKFSEQLRNIVFSAVDRSCCNILNRSQISIDSFIVTCLLRFWSGDVDTSQRGYLDSQINIDIMDYATRLANRL